MHRQVILDLFLTRDNIDTEDERVRKAQDLLWYFHDWKPKKDKNEKINKRVGVSMVDVTTEKNKVAYTGVEFVAGRLSGIGTAEAHRKMIAFNLGLSKAMVDEAASKFPGPLYDTLKETSLKGGLKARIRPYKLFGGLEPTDIDIVLKAAFDLDEDDPMSKLLKGEDIELIESIEEHVENVDEAIETGKTVLIDLVLDEKVRETYEEHFEIAANLAENINEDLEERLEEIMPELSLEAQTCQ